MLEYKAMWNREFQYFFNQHSNVYLEKDERQALRTRNHYIQILFLDDSICIFMRYPCLKSSSIADSYLPAVRFLFNKINSHHFLGKTWTSSAPYMLILYSDFLLDGSIGILWDIHVWKLCRYYNWLGEAQKSRSRIQLKLWHRLLDIEIWRKLQY